MPWRHLECLLDHVGGGEYLICYFWESMGVTAIFVDLCILSILAVRLPKLAVEVHLELTTSRGRIRVLVFRCPWVSEGVTRIYIFCQFSSKTAKTCRGGT